MYCSNTIKLCSSFVISITKCYLFAAYRIVHSTMCNTFTPQIKGNSSATYLMYTVAGSWNFLNYFAVISHLFTISQLFLTYFLSISQLFHSYFPFLTYFLSISCLFLDFDYFSLISQLFPTHFSLISQLFPTHFSLISHLFLEYFLILLCIQSSPQCSCIHGMQSLNV